jgi:hypothetical protein
MDRGLDPRIIDELPWRTVSAWLSVHDILEVRSSLGGLPDE